MSANDVRHAGLNLSATDALMHEQAGSAVFGFWVFLMSDAVAIDPRAGAAHLLSARQV